MAEMGVPEGSAFYKGGLYLIHYLIAKQQALEQQALEQQAAPARRRARRTASAPAAADARTAAAEAAAAAAVSFASKAAGHKAAAEAAESAAANQPATAPSVAGQEWVWAAEAWGNAWEALEMARRADPKAAAVREAEVAVKAARRLKHQRQRLRE